jgi:hypothetical protein
MKTRALAGALALGVLLVGCGDDETAGGTTTTAASETTSSSAADTTVGQGSVDGLVDPSFFDEAAMAVDPELVDCTLEDGTAARCWELTFWSAPDSVTLGPFCPTTIDDPDGGIWVWDGADDVEAGLYKLNEAFWEQMESAGYDFVEDDGAILITDPGGGAPPSGDGADSSCLQATPDDFTLTYQVPLTPSDLGEPELLDTVGHVGIALDGVSIFADAPSVHDTGALPALDPCGGHVDPNGYYHWHFVSDSIQGLLDDADVGATCGREQDASALFGFAYDGYPLYGPADQDDTVPDDLDECHGHVGPTRQFPDGAYHYHATLDAPNLPPCLIGAIAEEHFDGPGGGAQGAGPPGGDGGPP